MLRRMTSFLLALILVLGLVAVAAPTVQAVGDLKTSEDMIELIKAFEGFTPRAKGDYGHYSIGYGTSCELNEYPNGITKAEADKLMRKVLVGFESSVNYFAKRNNLKLSQHQFDTLMSLTYNLGPGWLKEDSRLTRAIISGARDNEFLYAITMWCTAGVGEEKQILATLRRRRLMEANVYLNGRYETTVPANYDYVLFGSNLTDADGVVRIQGYDSSLTDYVRPEPTKAGYRFLGWYTKATGGEWVTVLDASMAGKTLYGHWQKGNGDSAGTAAKYERVTERTLNVYDQVGGKVVKQISAGTSVTVTADYMDANGVKWGKVSGGWIDLSKTRGPKETADSTANVRVTVHTDGVNIRSGPGTNYAKVGKANKGQVLTITAVKQGANYLWGQFSGGWICLDYTDYDDVMADKPAEDETVTATGVITGCDTLKIRNRPGTNETTVVGTYNRGDKVTITLQEEVRGTMWGKTDRGWISLYYVKLTPAGGAEDEKPEDTQKPDDTQKPEDKPGDSQTPEGAVVAKGIVTGCTSLRIRKGPGTRYESAGSLAGGTQVEIYEITGSGSQVWARIDKGWISMNYVKLQDQNTGNGGESGGQTGGTGDETGQGVSGVVYNCTRLNVRSAPGTNNSRVTRLDAGTKVQVYETTKVGSVTWGRIAQGWVSMEYIKLSGNTTPEPEKPGTTEKPDPKPDTPETGKPGDTTVRTGTVVKTDEVRLRAGAGTQYDKVGTLKKGERIVILEQVKVGSATWGRTEKGWVHMYYVQLDSQEAPAGTVTGTVTGDYVNIRAGAGTHYAKVGTYRKGEVIIIYEKTTVGSTTWGRTDKGWVSMAYVK